MQSSSVEKPSARAISDDSDDSAGHFGAASAQRPAEPAPQRGGRARIALTGSGRSTRRRSWSQSQNPCSVRATATPTTKRAGRLDRPVRVRSNVSCE